MEEIRYNLIADALEKKGKTAYWLSTVLEVSPATTTRWANNQTQPSLQVLHEIAGALGLDAKTLIVKTKDVKEQLPERFKLIKERASEPKRERGRPPNDSQTKNEEMTIKQQGDQYREEQAKLLIESLYWEKSKEPINIWDEKTQSYRQNPSKFPDDKPVFKQDLDLKD